MRVPSPEFTKSINNYLETNICLDEAIEKTCHEILEKKEYQSISYEKLLFDLILLIHYLNPYNYYHDLKSNNIELIKYKQVIIKNLIKKGINAGYQKEINFQILQTFDLELFGWTLKYNIKINKLNSKNNSDNDSENDSENTVNDLFPFYQLLNRCNGGVYDMKDYQNIKEKIKILIKYGYNINIGAEGTGNTPIIDFLSRVAFNNSNYSPEGEIPSQIKMLNFLIKSGVNLYKRNKDNKTGLDILLERIQFNEKYQGQPGSIAYILNYIYQNYYLTDLYNMLENNGLFFSKDIREKIFNYLKVEENCLIYHLPKF